MSLNPKEVKSTTRWHQKTFSSSTTTWWTKTSENTAANMEKPAENRPLNTATFSPSVQLPEYFKWLKESWTHWSNKRLFSNSNRTMRYSLKLNLMKLCKIKKWKKNSTGSRQQQQATCIERRGREPFVGSMLLCGRAAGKKSARRWLFSLAIQNQVMGWISSYQAKG